MSEAREIYDPTTAEPWVPAKDWVRLSNGRWVCVWELSVPENFQVGEAGRRHPQDPRPGNNEQELAVWLIAYAAHRGEEPGSPRIWNDMQIHLLLSLPPDDFTKLLVAARGLLGTSEEAEERARDFIPGAEVSGRPASSTGVSSTSTGIRLSSEPPEWVSSPGS